MSRNFSTEIDDYVKNSSEDKADAIINWVKSTLGVITGHPIKKFAAGIRAIGQTIKVIDVVIRDITPLEGELMGLPEFGELAQLVLICNNNDKPYVLYANGTICNCLDKNHDGCRCVAEIYKEAYDAAQKRYGDYKEGREQYLKAVYDYLYAQSLLSQIMQKAPCLRINRPN